MSTQKKARFTLSFLSSLILIPSALLASPPPTQWTGTQSSDLNIGNNWEGSAVPGTTDTTYFKNTATTRLSPTAIADFSVGEINFIQSAAPFNFLFTQCGLILNGNGITGNLTNATFALHNINHSTPIENQILLQTATATSLGSAQITATNSGSASGTGSEVTSSKIYAMQLNSSIPVSLSDGFLLSAINTGTDSTIANGNNSVAWIGSSLMGVDSVIAGKNVTITLANTGSDTGSDRTNGNQVGYVTTSMFASEALIAGDDFSFTATNSGTDSSQGSGSNNVGYVGDSQVKCTSLTVGKNAIFSMTNEGENSQSSLTSSTGYIGSDMLNISGEFSSLGNTTHLTCSNTGTDTSDGSGNNKIGFLDGGLVSIDSIQLRDFSTISLANTGSNTGTNSTTGNFVGSMTDPMISVTTDLSAGDFFSFTATNTGHDSCDEKASESGSNRVGFLSSEQVKIAGIFTVKNSATIALTNTGSCIGSKTGVGNYAGVISSPMLDTNSLLAQDSFSFTATNTGTDSSTGVGGNWVGYVDSDLVSVTVTFIVGDFAIIDLTNTGSFTGISSDFEDSVGYIATSMLSAVSGLTVGDDFSFTATNTGTDSSTGYGYNKVGYIGSRQVSSGASLTVGDRALFTLTNAGTHSTSSSHCSTGYVDSEMLLITEAFHSGNRLQISCSNTGNNTGTGDGNNTIGYVGGSQIQADSFSITDNIADIQLINAGTSSGTGSNNNNSVGYINSSMFSITNALIAPDHFSFTATNTGTNSGTGTGGNMVGYIDSSILSSSTISTGDDFLFSATNTGTDSSTGSSGNKTGYLEDSQVTCTTFTVGKQAQITLTNTGTHSSTGKYSSTGYINGNMLNVTGTFSSSEDLTHLICYNTGNNTSTGDGGNEIGHVDESQVSIHTISLGNLATITLNNEGTSSGSNSTSSNSVGYVSSSMLSIAASLTAGDDFSLTATNIGTDSSTGYGDNSVGYVGFDQITCDSLSVGKRASFVISNEGTNSSSPTNPSYAGHIEGDQLSITNLFSSQEKLSLSISNKSLNTGDNLHVGDVHGNQLTFGSCSLQSDSSFEITNTGLVNASQIDMGSFTATDNVSLSTSNSGIVRASQTTFGTFNTGKSLSFVTTNEGNLNNSQVLTSSFTTGDSATITVTNTGSYAGSFEKAYSGSIGQSMFSSTGAIVAGDDFHFTATNTGTDSSTGDGENEVGYIGDIQVTCGGSITVGDRAIFIITNEGTHNTASPSCLTGYVDEEMLHITGAFQSGNHVSITCSNTGTDTSTGDGDNDVGYVGSSLVSVTDAFTVGNFATIALSNEGTCSGNASTDRNFVGYVDHSMFASLALTAGDDFRFTATNTGTDSSTGVGGNWIGAVESDQVGCASITVGANASFVISNEGNNSSSPTNPSHVGYISGNQFSIGGNFTAGENLSLSISNNLTNTGDLGADLGRVDSNQLHVGGDCFLSDGSSITISNEGTGSVGGSQAYFKQGLKATGTVTLSVTNPSTATVTNHGIYIDNGVNSVGGDILVSLGNNDLYIDTTNTTFTIGALNGDSSCAVQSKPLLTINLDATTHAVFGGEISDFPSATSALTIDGLGSQKLSGTNTFTGLTTIEGGTLILSGSLSGDVLINPLGTLKGTGTAPGVTNLGTISPGESIGILHLTTYTNTGGTYFAEVNGAGESDLIDVSGTATLSGGTVLVDSVDGTYQFQNRYTIVSANSVTGTYSDAVGVSAAIAPTLSYDSQNVYLTLTTQFGQVANTHNEQNIANQLDHITNPTAQETAMLSQVASLNSADLIRSALDSLSGWQYTTDLFVSQVINQQFVKRLYDALRFLTMTDPKKYCLNEWDVWLEGGGTYTGLQGNANAHGLTMNGGEISTGIQKTFGCNWTLGASLSYEHDFIRYKNDGGHGYTNSYLSGIYGLYNSSYAYAFGDLTYGYSANRMSRRMVIGSSILHAHSKPKISQCTFYAETGGNLLIKQCLFQPFFGLSAGGNWLHHISETSNSGWQMDIHHKQCNLVKSRLGVHLSSTHGKNYINIDCAWNQRITGPNANIGGNLALFGGNFIIDGVNLNSASVDYALTFARTIHDFTLTLQGSGETWNKAYRCDILAGVQYSW